MPRSAIIESKRGQAPPSRIPPLSGTLGAPAAHRSASEAEARGLGKTDSHARRGRVFRPLAIESKRGQAPPSRIPPLSGTLGAPAAHRSASEAEARGLGKTDSHARRSRVFRQLATLPQRASLLQIPFTWEAQPASIWSTACFTSSVAAAPSNTAAMFPERLTRNTHGSVCRCHSVMVGESWRLFGSGLMFA